MILLIDDDRNILESYIIVMELNNYRVQIAETPDDAIDAIKQYGEKLNLIILDLMMPTGEKLNLEKNSWRFEYRTCSFRKK